MMISLIVAASDNGVIGRDGGIPWRLPADMQLFRRLTMGHYLILGRKTFEAIGGPLRGRKMIVLTRQQDYAAEGCTVTDDLDKAIEIAREDGEMEAFIGGGAVVYAQALPLADRIYLSRVHAEIAGDTFLPAINEQEWTLVKSQEYPPVEGQEYAFTFQILERKPEQDTF
ncbi:MAG: dihydrofolate reductase [Anaerolineales bacterium]|jgi:dihydrofolate reductase